MYEPLDQAMPEDSYQIYSGIFSYLNQTSLFSANFHLVSVAS